jgi:hypothetical protein
MSCVGRYHCDHLTLNFRQLGRANIAINTAGQLPRITGVPAASDWRGSGIHTSPAFTKDELVHYMILT